LPAFTVIAGPNGSGKSTLTRFLNFSGKENLFDPDAIAREIAPAEPSGAALSAGRAALERRNECLAKRIDFSIETTLAGSGVLTLMKQAKAQGFDIRLIYVAVDGPERNIQRVRERVAAGGHFVPPEDVRRRYERSLANAHAAILIADFSIAFDNSEDHHRKIFEARDGLVTWSAPDLPAWALRVVADLERAKPARA
jgi:predicted ABC-type ATPase